MYSRKEIDEKTINLLYKAYEEQFESGENINRRVPYFVAANSLLLTAVVSILKILIDKNIEVLLSIIFSIIIISLLLLSLVLCVLINFLTDIKAFPHKHLLNEVNKIGSEEEMNMAIKGLIFEIVDSNYKNNEKKSKLFNASAIIMIIAIALIFVATLTIIIVHL